MRAIDADELIEALVFCKRVECIKAYADVIDEIIEVVNDFPTLTIPMRALQRGADMRKVSE